MEEQRRRREAGGGGGDEELEELCKHSITAGGEGWCLKVLNLNSTAIFYTATDHCSWMARRIYKRGYLKDLDLWALHNHGFPFLEIEDPQKLGNLSPALRGWSLEAFWNNGFFKNIFWVLTTFIYATLSNTLFKIRRQ